MVYSDMDCPHCARPLEFLSERKDVSYICKSPAQISEVITSKWKCTFCPVTIDMTYTLPTEYLPLSQDSDDSDLDM